MKKIITAINHPKLNEELKKEKNFEVIARDIQYKEAILEILEKNNQIDIIIINEKIPGEIKIEELIQKIKIINQKIKIIFILEKENNELEKILIKNNIIDIYYNNKINLKELIKIINKKENNMEEEIIELKKIIEEKNNYIKKNEKEKKQKKKRQNNLKKEQTEKMKNKNIKIVNQHAKKTKRKNFPNNMSTKIITFFGNEKSGKSTLSLIMSHYLAKEKNKVLLIDGDRQKKTLSIWLKKGKNCKKGNYNIDRSENNNKYFRNENRNKNKTNKTNKKTKPYKRKIYFNKNKIKINKKLIDKKNMIKKNKIKKIIKQFTKKINKNFYFFYGLNNLLKNEKEKNQKKIINYFFEQIEKKYKFILIDLVKNNKEAGNKEILQRSTIIFIVIKPILSEIKAIKILFKIYFEKWKIEKNKINIIINKKTFNSINKKLISNCLFLKNKNYEIKENKNLKNLIKNYFKKNYLLKDKKTKKQIYKIIKKIKKDQIKKLF